MKVFHCLFLAGLAAFGIAGAALADDDVPRGAPLIANGAWSNLLDGGHPRLIGSTDALVVRAKTQSALYAGVKNDHTLVSDAIVNVVEGADRDRIGMYIDLALGNVSHGTTNEHQNTWIRLTDSALAYDLYYDRFTPGERKMLIDWMNTHLTAYTEDEGAFHNSTLSKIACYLKVAYATWGDNPKAKDFRDYAINKLYEGKIVPVFNAFGAGGGFTECGWYTRHSLWHLVEALELARRLEGYDGFAKAPKFFYERLAYEMLQPFPGLWTYGAERYPCEGDGSIVYGGHNEFPREMRSILAQYFRGSELAGYIAAKRRAPSNGAAKVTDFLYMEEPDKPLDINTFPLAHIATGIGKVYARSDWKDDATWFRFECGPYWSGHQHFEVGNFEIFRYEPLATESGEYTDYTSNHDVNWLLRTIAHNCILVYDPNEKWTNLRDGGRNKYANDGGQAKKWEWTVGDLSEWEAKRADFERGQIVGYENRPEYMFVAADCTKAYSPEKLSSWVRQIVFVRPSTFVIYDRVVSTKAEYPKTWLVHCRNKPTISGNEITMSDGSGRLVMRTLLPAKPSIKAIEGYTYGGESFNTVETSQTPVAVKWRVEVKPQKAAAEDVFLHVMFTDRPENVKLINKDGRVGVTIGKSEVVFDGAVGGTIKAAGKEYPLEPKVKTGKWEN